jgi:mono/diheme cytochrome c family protein
MRKILLCIIALFIGAALISTKGAQGGEHDRGKNLYKNKCQMCHGADGKGNGPSASAFNPKPADFADPKFWQRKDINKYITDTIDKGHGMMPSFDLKPAEIKDIIDYLAHTFKPKS